MEERREKCGSALNTKENISVEKKEKESLTGPQARSVPRVGNGRRGKRHIVLPCVATYSGELLGHFHAPEQACRVRHLLDVRFGKSESTEQILERFGRSVVSARRSALPDRRPTLKIGAVAHGFPQGAASELRHAVVVVHSGVKAIAVLCAPKEPVPVSEIRHALGGETEMVDAHGTDGLSPRIVINGTRTVEDADAGMRSESLSAVAKGHGHRVLASLLGDAYDAVSGSPA